MRNYPKENRLLRESLFLEKQVFLQPSVTFEYNDYAILVTTNDADTVAVPDPPASIDIVVAVPVSCITKVSPLTKMAMNFLTNFPVAVERINAES